jgi:hypothetical protein
MRKSAAAAVLALLAAAVFSGCVVVSFTTASAEGMERGRGPLIEKRFETGPYTEIEIRADVAVVYSKEPSDAVVVKIQENLAELLRVEAQGDLLVVEAERRFLTQENETPVLYISAPELTRLQAAGEFEFRGGDTISGERFALYVEGSAEIDMDLDVQLLTVDLAGASATRLSGAAEEARIDVSGAGNLDALELDTVRAAVRMSGAGNASISCSETLDVSLNGAASLKYRGKPAMTSDIRGAGSVHAVK